MTPAQSFGVVVRTIGLLMMIASSYPWIYGFVVASNPGVLVAGAIWFLVGFWLVRWPNWLIAFAYPRERVFYPLAADKQSPHSTAQE